MSRKCFLKCITNSHEPIPLLHKIETVIGRNKASRISNKACSSRQLILKADCEKCLVEIKPTGVNPSGLDGFAIKNNATYEVGHGTRIEILLNQYVHVIEFDPPPENFKTTKRKLEIDYDSANKKTNLRKSIEKEVMKDSIIMNETLQDLWENIDKGELYVFTAKGVKSSNKIAAFDMDGTLIKTKSGKAHPEDIDDWQIAFPSVQNKLREQFSLGFKIVILSNQAPIGNGRVKIEDFKNKIESIVQKLSVPIQIYLATGKGIYRKPVTGMWKVLTEQKNDGIYVNMTQSFYVGDAAGRAANWAPGKKKDHSMADKLLAENLGLKFYTPEQYFLGHSIANVPMLKPQFNPKELKSEPFDERLISKEKEILVLVGYPGSGKSFIAKQIEKLSNYQYVAVCRDVLGSWQKCAAEATKLLQRGKSVVVDSTNPDLESRGRWTSLAKQMNVVCRCAKLATSKAHALHNNKFRELMKINHVPVNEIVFHSYGKKFVEPKPSEGFKEVIEVKFNLCFDNSGAKTLYTMHLLEK